MSPKTTESGGRTGRRERLLTPARITVLLLAVLALIFIFENTHDTRIRLLIPEVTMPLWMALLATAIIGALCGAYFMRRRRRP
ncbi:LapA family protein [Streptomyces sp. W16]|uniref:LapA family protein n=1 Tax=Streptomyces sp. W16 TaxID=3076631 RepID=UPI00295AD11C|nr:LapA family protein [Streptomyces sp. W16]MDV9177315.1 LapA family protein [Streptomyces sp. W16]